MKFVSIIAVLFLFGSHGFSGEVVKFNDFLKSELGGSAKTSKETFALSTEQQSQLKAVAENASETNSTFYYGKSGDGKLEKACTTVAQKGKEGPMTVGVCFVPNGLVSSIVVLVHEEERGKKAIEGEGFIKQFKGKPATSAFVVGKDVDGVTGATWTSKAISEAVRKASFCYSQFVEVKK